MVFNYLSFNLVLLAYNDYMYKLLPPFDLCVMHTVDRICLFSFCVLTLIYVNSDDLTCTCFCLNMEFSSEIYFK